MQDSIKITRGKRILINDGPEYIEFDPGDVLFAEKFYSLMREFETRMDEFKVKSAEIDANEKLDEHGFPANAADKLALMRALADFIRDRIDYVFGVGTSQKAFGDSFSLDMVSQLFEGLTPFIGAARTEKINRYTNTVTDKRKRHVLK
jgi:hypothetical protein